MTSRHAFSPHLTGAIAPSAVAGCLPALIFVRMVAEQVCSPPYLPHATATDTAFSACDDNRAHAAIGIARVVVVRIAVVVRVGKVGSGSHIGNKPKICHCLFLRNFAYCALVLACHALMAFSSFSVSSTYGISFSLSTGMI